MLGPVDRRGDGLWLDDEGLLGGHGNGAWATRQGWDVEMWLALSNFCLFFSFSTFAKLEAQEKLLVLLVIFFLDVGTSRRAAKKRARKPHVLVLKWS